MKAYTINKVSKPEDMSKMYEYFKDIVKDVELYNLGTFIEHCMNGRSYVALNSIGDIVGGLMMIEYEKYIYIGYWHIDKKYRRYSKVSILRQLYDLVAKYSRDKNKDVYTKLNDYNYNFGKAITKSDIDGLHKIDIGLGDAR